MGLFIWLIGLERLRLWRNPNLALERPKGVGVVTPKVNFFWRRGESLITHQ